MMMRKPTWGRLAIGCVIILLMGLGCAGMFRMSSRPKAPDGMVYVPGGSYIRGQTRQDWPTDADAPQFRVTVSPFFMDKYEVSNVEYRKWVSALRDPYATTFLPDTTLWWAMSSVGRFKVTAMSDCFRNPSYDNYPVVGITWAAADSFARHHGKRLPKEAEWEYAARGGIGQREFPWGDLPWGKNGEFRANFRPYQGDFIADGYVYTAPCHCYWPNGFGLYNMAGNVAEWCWDDYSPTAYRRVSPNDPLFLYPPGEKEHPDKVVRGGSWASSVYFISCGTRGHAHPDSQFLTVGFRCAKDTDQ